MCFGLLRETGLLAWPEGYVVLREGPFCEQLCLFTFTPRLRRSVVYLLLTNNNYNLIIKIK